MEIALFRRTRTGNVYIIRNESGAVIGRVEWIMAGDNVGVHVYSHDAKYKPARLRKAFRAALLQMV